jgi:hypothetical protein
MNSITIDELNFSSIGIQKLSSSSYYSFFDLHD